MEKPSPLKSFMALANFDQALNKTRLSLERLSHENSTFQKHLLELEAKSEAGRQVVKNSQRIVHEYELSMKELDTNLQRQKKLLETVTNQKEYNATKNAINQIRQQQHDDETTLLDAWNNLENARANSDREQQELAQQIADFQNQIVKNNTEIEVLRQELQEHMQKRQSFLKDLPQEWLEKYEGMYTKVTNPIVQLTGNSCGACFHEATPQVIMNLKQRRLLECQGCYRFLFFEKEEPNN